METRFFKRFNCFCTINARIQDLKLIHPINKIIKPSQVYNDNQDLTESFDSYKRTLSQEPKIKNSIVLEPLSAKPRASEFSPRAVSINRRRNNLKTDMKKRSLDEEDISYLLNSARKYIERTPKVKNSFKQW